MDVQDSHTQHIDVWDTQPSVDKWDNQEGTHLNDQAHNLSEKKENIPPTTLEIMDIENCPPPKDSPSISQRIVSKEANIESRRREIAEWIESLVGEPIPAGTDQEFRGVLRDGVILCKLLNKIRPGTIPKIAVGSRIDSQTGERIRSMENVTNFLSAVQQFGMPHTSFFAMPDLESTGQEERPRVAECLLALRRLHETKDLKSIKLRLPNVSPALSPTTGLKTTVQESGRQNTSYDLGLQRANSGTAFGHSLSNRAPSRPGTAEGVTKLLHQCSDMLRQRMWLSDSQPASTPLSRTSCREETPVSDGVTIETVGPVLESVLGSLTQEYEKRLLAKDQEVKAAVEAQRRLQKEVELLRQELIYSQTQLEQLKLLPSSGLLLEDSKEIELLRIAESELKNDVSRLEEQYLEAEERARQRESAAQQLANECEALRDKMEDFSGLSEKYRSVAEENRRLYNEVQDLKGSIRVFCRVRPAGITGDASSSCVAIGVDGELAAYNVKTGHPKVYKFDKVFGPDSTQDEVYEDTKPLIRSVLDGYNVCIFAYGQTGSGKTHTMAGTNVHQYAGRGINYRALDDLFSINKERSDEVQYEIRVQLLEIYNEQLQDLLVEDKTQRRLDVRVTEKSGNNVPFATQVRVSCTEDVLEVMEIGARNRAVAETKMNQRSSRSHSVLTITVDGDNTLTGTMTHGCLHLIDLAGSERVLKSEATGDRLEEAKHINKSLSALGDVMAALAAKSSHIPFRNSKLTQLLQDSLCGQAKAMMFIHIAPEAMSFGETISTLGFGNRVSEITLGQAKKNSESVAIFKTKEELVRERQNSARLQEQLTMQERLLEEAEAEKAAMERQLEEMKARLTSGSQVHDVGPNRSSSPENDARRVSTSSSRMSSFDGSRLSRYSTATPPSVPLRNMSRIPAPSPGGATPRGAGTPGGSTTPRSARSTRSNSSLSAFDANNRKPPVSLRSSTSSLTNSRSTSRAPSWDANSNALRRSRSVLMTKSNLGAGKDTKQDLPLVRSSSSSATERRISLRKSVDSKQWK